MPFIKLILVIIVSSLILWLFNTVLPVDEIIVKLINVIMLVFLILYVFGALGLLGKIHGISIEW